MVRGVEKRVLATEIISSFNYTPNTCLLVRSDNKSGGFNHAASRPPATAVERTSDPTAARLMPNNLEKPHHGRHTRLPGYRHPYKNTTLFAKRAGCLSVY